MKNIVLLCLPFLIYASSCKEDSGDGDTMMEEMDTPAMTDASADIISVTVSGNENSYTFNVGIKSAETGCNQYADWWEVVSEEGTLIYRRILAHSHVNEQPFVRSGGAVKITEEQVIYVRAHMNNNGYGTKVFKGNVAQGFEPDTLEKDFASTLQTMAPLPTGCAF